MNFHLLVRPVITTVNPDISGTWRESTGVTIDSGGRSTPTYTDHTGVRMQVQAQTGKDLQHPAGSYISQQGVLRSVYVYGNYQGVARPDDKGGDLLIFPEVPGGANKTWLVTTCYETWPDWCKVGVVLQTDTTT